MKTHELKCWPAYFEAIKVGKKNFEYRLNDRDFKVGDVLHLREYEPQGAYEIFRYTGRELFCMVTYLVQTNTLPGYQYNDNYCIMSIKKIDQNALLPNNNPV